MLPYRLQLPAFADEDAASKALEQLKELKKTRIIGIIDAAVIRRDDDGKLHIKETADMTAKKGAGIGALIGGVVGLLAGPVGLVVGGGALVGWLAARRDKGFKDGKEATSAGRALRRQGAFQGQSSHAFETRRGG